jgi:hypothetical protein
MAETEEEERGSKRGRQLGRWHSAPSVRLIGVGLLAVEHAQKLTRAAADGAASKERTVSASGGIGHERERLAVENDSPAQGRHDEVVGQVLGLVA